MGKNVEIYTTPTCAFCHATKEFFKEHNVTFTEHDVASDEESRTKMIELSGQMGVPVIKIGDELIIGFNKNKLAEALGVNNE